MSDKNWKEMFDSIPSVVRKMSIIAFQMDMARDPEDALLDWKAGEDKLEAYHNSYFTSLVQAVAKKTGADPAQIADKNKRTEEQQQALLMEAGRLQMARLNHFFESNYVQALDAIEGEKTEYDVEPKEGTYGVKELSVLYFFSRRPDLKPSEKAALTDKDIAELKKYLTAFDRFYVEHKGDESRDILTGFIERSLDEIIPESITSERLKDFNFPIDKVNKTFWRKIGLEKDSTSGQLQIHMESHTSQDPVILYCAISFDELINQGITITKKLTAYEKRVYIAAGALYALKEQKPFTYTELYYAMGYSGRPGDNDLEKLAAAITKMGGARIYVDNAQEIAAKYNYPRFRYDGYLLPMERVSAIVNGKITDAAIHLFREPPLISFARQRNQITQINIELLQSPASKTESNIMIEDYLIERIAQARNERRKLEKKRCKTDEERRKKAEDLAKMPRILLETLYSNTDITTGKQKQRAPKKIARILDHYQKCGFIKHYEMDNDGITIAL